MDKKTNNSTKIDRGSVIAIAVIIAAIIACAVLFLWVLPAHMNNDAETVSDTNDTAAQTEQEEDTSAEDTDAETGADTETPATTLDFSAGIEDTGYFTGIRALDYVTLVDDYDTPKISAADVEIPDGLIESDILGLTSQYGISNPAGRPAELNDFVDIDFVGRIDGEEFPGGSAEAQSFMLGSGGYIDGFESQIVGHEEGETFDITVTFPDDYEDGVNSDGTPLVFAGKEAVFTITLNSVSEKILTEDGIQSAFGDVYTLENGDTIDSVEKVREYFKESEYRQALYNSVIGYLVENSTFTDELPQTLVDLTRKNETDYLTDMATSAGYEDANQYVQLAGYESLDAYLDSEQEYFNNNIMFELVMQAIAETESITCSDSILEEMYGDVYSDYVTHYGKGYMAQQYLYDTIMTQLCDNVVVS